MTPLVSGAIVFICVFAGSLGGLALRVRVPDRYLDADSRDAMKLVVGLVSTVTAMVLSLMIAASNAVFVTQDSNVAPASGHDEGQPRRRSTHA